jgi:hypothetical protein
MHSKTANLIINKLPARLEKASANYSAVGQKKLPHTTEPARLEKATASYSAVGQRKATADY